MTFLLDTNVLSETMRPRPDANVLRFLHETDEDRLAISVLTLAEIARGVALLAAGARRTALETWLSEDLVERFAGRTLHVDVPVALTWARVMAETQARGRNLHVVDGLIAATALVHRRMLVTRNEKDFSGVGLAVFNPWSGASPPDPAVSPA